VAAFMNSENTTRKRERRFTERFSIPDGITYFRHLRRFNLLKNFLGPFPMYDIASNSARFECSQDIEIQSEIELKIKPPGYHEELCIKGKVIKRADTTQKYTNSYVVQFSPFGKGYQYNTYESKSKLRQYIQAMKANK
jgi:hypothetical protein